MKKNIRNVVNALFENGQKSPNSCRFVRLEGVLLGVGRTTAKTLRRQRLYYGLKFTTAPKRFTTAQCTTSVLNRDRDENSSRFRTLYNGPNFTIGAVVQGAVVNQGHCTSGRLYNRGRCKTVADVQYCEPS
jgi:hypothetical protein